MSRENPQYTFGCLIKVNKNSVTSLFEPQFFDHSRSVNVVIKLKMNSLALALLLIALNFVCHSAKEFDECEFARELFERHLVPRDEIYKHFCIANTLHTAKNFAGFHGIYAIGSQWWCGDKEPGGNCNVKCSALLDDDIEDDVKCATLILSQQGVNGWSRNDETCQRAYGNKTENCLAEVEILNGLAGALIQTTSSTPEPSTEPSTTTTSTSRTTTVRATTAVPEPLLKGNATERKVSCDTLHQELQKAPTCSCAAQNTLLLIIALASCGASAFFVFKNRNLKRHSNSSNMEYENHLIS